MDKEIRDKLTDTVPNKLKGYVVTDNKKIILPKKVSEKDLREIVGDSDLDALLGLVGSGNRPAPVNRPLHVRVYEDSK